MKRTSIIPGFLIIIAFMLFGLFDVAAQEVLPQGADAQAVPSFWGTLRSMAPMLLICYAIFWFMVVRPQEKKLKSHKELMDSLKKGDSVVTTSGIVGRVQGQEEGYVILEVAPNVRLKIEGTHVARRERGESKKAA